MDTCDTFCRGMTDGVVWKLQNRKGQWIETTPDKSDPQTRAFGYAAFSVDAKNKEGFMPVPTAAVSYIWRQD
jgi:hypothetical protein